MLVYFVARPVLTVMVLDADGAMLRSEGAVMNPVSYFRVTEVAKIRYTLRERDDEIFELQVAC